jgi:hypothetical protein
MLGANGDDTLTINDRPMTDFADDDVINCVYPNNKAVVKTGKNKNTLYAKNEAGANMQMTLRVIQGSGDDKYLNSLSLSQDRDFAGFVMLKGQYVKRVGNGQGSVSLVTYNMDGGIFEKNVEGKENVSGDTSQAVAIYIMHFASADRGIM